MGNAFKKPRVAFRDLEDALKMDDLRHMYLECNTAVHAGANRIITRTDFRRAHPFATDAEVDLHSTGRIGQASVRVIGNLPEWACADLNRQLLLKF